MELKEKKTIEAFALKIRMAALEARENDVIVSTWTLGNRKAVGVFSMRGTPVSVEVPLSDGAYRDLLSEAECAVQNGTVASDGKPLVFLVG